MKLAGVVLDQQDDNGALVDKTKIPLWIIKTASDEPKKVFAFVIVDGENRVGKFPLDTPYDAYVSALYFEKTALNLPSSYLPTIAARIRRALKAHKIEEEFPLVEALAEGDGEKTVVVPKKLLRDEPTAREKIAILKKAKKLTYKERQSLPDSAFALVVETPKGKIRKYPIHDEAHVRNALVRFSQHHDKLPPKYRAIVARKIKEKAKQFGIEISPDNPINKYASDELSPYFWQALQIRKEKTRHPAYGALEKTASLLEPMKVAQVLEVIDKASGFDKLWDVYGDPYETVFSPHKTAAEAILGKDPIKEYKRRLYNKLLGPKLTEIVLSDEKLEEEITKELDLPTL